MDLRDFEIRHGKQISEEHSVLVDRAGLPCRDSPVGDQPLVGRRFFKFSRFGHAGEYSQHRVGIADIKNQEHVWVPLSAISYELSDFGLRTSDFGLRTSDNSDTG